MKRSLFTVEPTSIRAFALKSVTELAIIVIGVLLALAADDWWTDQEERAEEVEILQAIEQDVFATQEAVRATHNRQQSILDDLRTLSESSAGRIEEVEDSTLAELLLALWDTPSISVQMSAHDEIQDSGRLRLIESPELRRVLAEYDRQLSDARQAHEDIFQHQQIKLDPYLIANVQLSQLSGYALSDTEGAIPIDTRLDTQDHRVLLDDAIFQNQVVAKYLLMSSYYAETRELLDTLNELKVRLDARVDEIRQ